MNGVRRSHLDAPGRRAATPGGPVVRTLIAATLCTLAALLAVHPAAARAEVPVSVRVIKGSRQGPAKLDPRLDDLRRQLSPLAYVRWEQVSEKRLDLKPGRTELVELPDGDSAALTLQERHGDTVTFEVALTSRNTQSRLTVQRGQRIVHQVTGERKGEALFLTVNAWP